MGTCHSSKNKVIKATNPPDKVKADNSNSNNKSKKDGDNQDTANKEDQHPNNSQSPNQKIKREKGKRKIKGDRP